MGCRMIISCRTYNLILNKRLNPWTNDLPISITSLLWAPKLTFHVLKFLNDGLKPNWISIRPGPHDIFIVIKGGGTAAHGDYTYTYGP
jgi:hypothetical protein